MIYYVDGYNLLFRLADSRTSLRKQRTSIIRFLQNQFVHLKSKGLLIFDGAHRPDEESGLSYPSPMELAFTPKGQSADENILDRVEMLSNRKNATVVTNDQGLKRQAGAFGAKTMSNDAFLKWLLKRASKKKAKRLPAKDSPQQIERLTKIFEEKLKKDDFEDWI